MSYNRRGGHNFGNSVSSVGQRRPHPNNFIPGGQMTRHSQQNKGHQQNKPFQQQQQQQTPQQQQQNKSVSQQQQPKQVTPQQQTKPAVQQQQQSPQPQTQVQSQQPPKQVTPQPQGNPVQQSSPTQQQEKPAPPQQQNILQKSAEQLIAQQQEIQNLKNEDESQANTSNTEGEALPTKSKPFWMKRATGRISKAEKMRKRNLRLRKMLQPKNALMVLNELVGSTSYTIQEVRTPGFDDVFKAAVMVDGIEHGGAGKSKVGAKTAAAEAAIKHIVLKKICAINQSVLIGAVPETPPVEFINENEKMDEGNTSEEQEQVSWSHIASFAIHKLFASWDEDGNITDLISKTSSPGVLGLDQLTKRSGSSMSGFQMIEQQKPAKKLPENAALMNPIMLLNQMHPNAKYEEIAKTGSPPHIQFTIKCSVLDQEFVGVGRNKKTARKQAAFAACTQILGIQYPPEVLEDASKLPGPMETS